MPDISVIIPAYCEEKVIGGVVEKVRRVMDATGKSHEILVVNDGSDDKTAAEAQKAGARVISHPYDIGNGAAIKTGIRQAKGKILIMMDGSRFFLIIVKVATLFSPMRVFLPVSAVMFLTGLWGTAFLEYCSWEAATAPHRPCS